MARFAAFRLAATSLRVVIQVVVVVVAAAAAATFAEVKENEALLMRLSKLKSRTTSMKTRQATTSNSCPLPLLLVIIAQLHAASLNGPQLRV